jgi:predicted Fe-Mo cluster-binding NifX family protein
MKIAIPYQEDNTLYSHTGSTEAYKIYEVEGKNIISTEVVDSMEHQHTMIPAFLRDHGVNVLLCGDIGDHLFALLRLVDIKAYSTLEGNCDELVHSFLEGTLNLNEAPTHECGCHH